jgi:hypothetical protein
MSNSRHDSSELHDKTPMSVMYAVAAGEAIREASHRIQLAREVPERLDTSNLVAISAALEDITRGLAQFAGQVDTALPDSVSQHLTASQEIHDGLIAFRIAVLDASVAARSIGTSATALCNGTVPRQRHQ